MSPLHVASFAGGVVTEGAASTRKIDELSVADSLDIGPRGALVCASDCTDYVTLEGYTHQRFSKLHQLGTFWSPAYQGASAVGEGIGPFGALNYLLALFLRSGAVSPVSGAPAVQYFSEPWNHNVANPAPVAVPEGVVVTMQQFPGMFPGAGAVPGPFSVALINIGAREGYAASRGAGLYALVSFPAPDNGLLLSIDHFDALGTGAENTFLGTLSQQLRFRAIGIYGGFAMGWGYDQTDTLTNEGPARLMFSNVGTPLKWGNDNSGSVINRAFADTDAIIVGDGGERIRSGVNALGKFYLGTSRGLHFVQGYGRDTFIASGSVPVMKAFNVTGPRAMIEGPDRKLYGVGDQGLWAFDGYNPPEPIFQKVRDYAGASRGYFDLIWRNPGATGYPGATNGDLVWMAVDYLRQQVIVGIPFCNAGSGEGQGNDTVVIRYHVQSGGFTRQKFEGLNYTCAGYFRGEGSYPDTRFMGTPTGSSCRVRRYAYQTAPSVTPTMPLVLPSAGFGPYTPFGPDGQGVVRRCYLTLSWASASALPIVFEIRTTTDEVVINDYTLTIDQNAPAAPVSGDCWLDTSQTDQSIGNAVAGSNVPARGGFLLKTWNSGEWQVVAGQGGTGFRASIQLPLSRQEGTYVTIAANCVAASQPFQLEGLGMSPGGGTPDA